MELPKSIKQLQKGLLNKEFSAVDLVDLSYKRIGNCNKELNAFLTLSEDLAYQQAKRADKIIANEKKEAFISNPLLGVTVALKDLYLTKGIRTTAGSRVLQNYVPEYSSTVVNRIQDAGAVVLGKTNCDAWAHGASGENSDFGPSKNPWNKEFVPGGSSSGSAVAVAAGLSMSAMGTDTGGSIRQPANFCGVVGFKPTYGIVPRYGVVAMASSLDTMGHFTSTVEDSRKIFEITKGTDGYDSTLKDNPKENSKTSKGKYRIGVPKEYFIEGIDTQVENNVRNALKEFEKMGHDVVEISLPHTKYAISVYYIIQPAEVSSNLARYDGIRYGNSRDSFGDEAKRRVMLGSYVLSAGYYDAYYLKAMKVRSKIIEDFEKVFEEVDAVIAPVSPTPAFKLGEKANDPLQMYLADVLTVSANIAGIPGLALPWGFTQQGLPLGFQLMGPRFSEDTLFDLGEQFHKHVDYEPGTPLI